MTITARFASRCATCGQPIRAGEQIEWTKGAPARHVSCTATTAQTASPARTTCRSCGGPTSAGRSTCGEC